MLSTRLASEPEKIPHVHISHPHSHNLHNTTTTPLTCTNSFDVQSPSPTPSSGCLSSSPDTPTPSIHTSSSAKLLNPSHVEYKVGIASTALIGRAHQRYDGNTRLICGCVPFKLEVAASSQSIERNSNSTPLSSSSASSSSSLSNLYSSSATSSPSSSSQVLFLTIRSPDSWIFPKGGWETFETSEECAQRESREEAGVDGNLISELGSFEVHSSKGKYGRMKFYVMQVTTEYQEYADRGKRDRRWMTLEEAYRLVVRDEMKIILNKAVEKLKELGIMIENG